MLRLEKRRVGKEVVVRLRNKQKLWDAGFLFAFACAVGLHLFGFLLFHISAFKVDNNNNIFAPISVQIDYLPSDEFTIAETESERIRKRPVSEPKPSKLSMPAWENEPHEWIAVKMQPQQTNPFAQFALPSSLNPIDPPPIKAPSVELHISGPLAEIPLREVDLPKAEEVEAQKRKRMVYQVQVEGKTGKVFWYQPKEASRKMLAFGEKTLRSIQFEPDPKEFVISGEIEILKEL